MRIAEAKANGAFEFAQVASSFPPTLSQRVSSLRLPIPFHLASIYENVVVSISSGCPPNKYVIGTLDELQAQMAKEKAQKKGRKAVAAEHGMPGEGRRNSMAEHPVRHEGDWGDGHVGAAPTESHPAGLPSEHSLPEISHLSSATATVGAAQGPGGEVSAGAAKQKTRHTGEEVRDVAHTLATMTHKSHR